MNIYTANALGTPHGYSELESEPQRPTGFAALRVARAVEDELAGLQAAQATWAQVDPARLTELMTDDEARLAAMRQGHQLTRGIAVAEATLRSVQPEADQARAQIGGVVLRAAGVEFPA